MTEAESWSFSDMTLSVVGLLEEEGDWHTVALELDLHGYGDTFDKAVVDLMDHVKMQISFAIQKENPDLIRRSAEGIYWKLFATAQAEQFLFWSHVTDEERQIRTGGLNLPPAHVIAEMRGEFTLTANG